MEMNISNENPNNFHWKNKLEDLNDLSEETIKDKNVVWEKLYNRLHQKPRSIGFIWYWAAAVVLLMVIIIPAMRLNNTMPNLVKNSPAQVKFTKETVKEILPSKQIPAADKVTALIVKNKKTENIIQTKKSLQVNQFVKKEVAIKNNSSNKEIIEQDAENSPAVLNNVINTLAAAPVKKKLRVVHINELGDPVEESQTLARSYEHHSFKLNFINHQVYTNSLLPESNTGFTFFKTKITSN